MPSFGKIRGLQGQCKQKRVADSSQRRSRTLIVFNLENQLVWSFCLQYANENLGKQWDPCIIHISNLKVNFTKKKCALYTGNYSSLVRGRRYGGSRLFICTCIGHIRFWRCDGGFNWWLRRFPQVLSVSTVDCSVFHRNSVWALIKSCSDLRLVLRLVGKFEWLHSNNVAFR